ncbi:hypothetical protein GCM10023257_12430 [Streptomyces hyderabadensis]|uniref:Uncharacterized protein n=1 Tax=Streptomyces hyderabadensis TaxID=598549 RepID=A0ABP9HSH1_9ACTN
MKCARVETPSTRTASTQLMAIRVCRALRPWGSRKAEMPFEIASSPVREEPPLAKDRSTMKREAPYSQPSPGAVRSACGSSPGSARTAATRNTRPTETGSWRWSSPVQPLPARWASEISALVPADVWTATVTT